ncbi:MAG TPA: hypothetical protein VNK73_16900 [Actinomycetota bacterium]|jgi:hypothetical protein|nr:hypothetical protein [Actinomycetota bacterium]
MELVVGPFDPSIHVRSRDHYEAVRREAQFLELQPEAPPRRYEELSERLMVQFGHSQVDPVVDRAYLAREPSFIARIEIPDELVPGVIDACGELIRVSEELDRWAHDSGGEILEASPEIRAYRAAFLAQLRDQLEAGGARHPEPSR